MQSCILWKLNLENDLQKKADTKEGHWGKARPSSTPPTHVRTPSSPPLMFPSINPFVAQVLWPCSISLCSFFFINDSHHDVSCFKPTRYFISTKINQKQHFNYGWNWNARGNKSKKKHLRCENRFLLTSPWSRPSLRDETKHAAEKSGPFGKETGSNN